jgi:hypothetical protein
MMLAHKASRFMLKYRHDQERHVPGCRAFIPCAAQKSLYADI